MKLHTSLTEAEIRACLDRAKADDLPGDVVFDVFGPAGSRSHLAGYEIHLATARNDTRADGRKRSSSPLAGGSGLRYAATYDEWGWFLAGFFAADPDAKAGPYKSKDHFHATTHYAYAMGTDEFPQDTSEREPEPDDDTTPVSHATTDVIARIDDTLAGCWTPNHP